MIVRPPGRTRPPAEPPRFGGLIDDAPLPADPVIVYLPGDEPGLFTAPDPADPVEAPRTERLSAGQRRTARALARIAGGTHPLTGEPLHPDAPADAAPGQRARPLTCGTCTELMRVGYHNRTWLKCRRVGDTRGPGTDARGWWPACHAYQPRTTGSDAP